MTRDEAIELFRKHMPDVSRAERVIDFYAEAGMLKLDEPKSADTRAAELFWAEHLPANHILNALKRAGLKIVEK